MMVHARSKEFIGHSSTGPAWTGALSALVAAVSAALAAHVMVRVAFASTPFGGTFGLLTLYGESLAIALGLALLRVLRPTPSATGRKFLGTPSRMRETRSHEPHKSAA